jgi:small-conductance mechanosensitive channel
MAIELPSGVTSPQWALSTTQSEASSFDDRWAAWQAKGAPHDRAVRRKMALAAPIVIAVAAVVLYALLGR